MKSCITFFISVMALSLLMGCSTSDPEPKLKEEERQMQKLSKTWALGKVMYGGDDISNRFNGFSLTFTGSKTYLAAGQLGDYDYEPFKASGTWDFKNGNLSILSRNDGVDMAAQVSDKTLTLTFTMTEANGRTKGLGFYRFELVTSQ